MEMFFHMLDKTIYRRILFCSFQKNKVQKIVFLYNSNT